LEVTPRIDGFEEAPSFQLGIDSNRGESGNYRGVSELHAASMVGQCDLARFHLGEDLRHPR
jgi:hypothetical protein